MTQGWVISFSILAGIGGGGAALQLPGVAARRSIMLIVFAFGAIVSGIVAHKALSTVVGFNERQAHQLDEAQRMAGPGA